jgi:hypothetical protein
MVVFVVYMVSEDVKKRILDAVLDKQVNFFWVFVSGVYFVVLPFLCSICWCMNWVFKFNWAIHVQF